MKPTIGRIVIYKLTEDDVSQINRRRTSGSSIAERIKNNGADMANLVNLPATWPLGAQAHIGNWASPGDLYPCIIARVWPNEFGQDEPGINGQVFLDGNDTLWVTSAGEGTEPGQWSWPVKETA
jgi:hypothetical protein